MSNKAVNPSHYTSTKVAPIDLIKAYDLNFNLGNVIKYTSRAKLRGGREDLVKAAWYLLDELGAPREFVTTLTKHLSDESTVSTLTMEEREVGYV